MHKNLIALFFGVACVNFIYGLSGHPRFHLSAFAFMLVALLGLRANKKAQQAATETGEATPPASKSDA